MNNTNTTTSPNPFQMGTVNLPSPELKAFNQGMVTANSTIPTVTPVQPQTIPQSQNIATFGTQPINLPASNISQPTPQLNQAEQILRQTAVADTEAQKTNQNISKAMLELIPQLQGQTQELATQQKAFGVQNLKQNLLNLNNQIIQKQAEIQKDDIQLASEFERLDKNSGADTMGILSGQKMTLQKQAQIVRSLKNADIGILNAQALAAQGNIALAQDAAKQAVEVKYAPYKELLETLKMQSEALQPILTADEKKQVREQTLKTNLLLKDLELQKQNEQKANDMVINAMPFAPQNVTAAAQKVISQGGNLVQVAQALGKYAGDFLGNQLKLSSIKENEMQIAKIANDIKQSQSTIPNNAPVGSTNYSITSWTNSAKNKSSLTSEERSGISKSFSVVNQLGALQLNLKKDQTSFFGGNVKKLMASIGQNADAGAINAQITALVPQIAKGVYGEVGVLTDQDTARYKEVLPNLTSPEQQNDVVTALTLTALKNGVKSKLDVAAASNLDVSGFVPLYQDLTTKIDVINDRTGVNDVRVGEIVKTNPQAKPLVEALIKEGKKGSEILQVLGAD